MTLIQQQIKSVFARLPQEIRDLITSEDFNDRIEVIAKKHGLDDVETGTLIRTTVRLLIGVIAPTQFVLAVTENIEIERDKAALIAQDINRDIFNPVKEELKQVHALPVGADGAATKPASESPTPAPAFSPQVSPKLSPTGASLPTSAPAAQTPTAPHLAAPSQSIFEQKMGGTFRLKSDTTSHAGAAAPAVAPSAVMPSPSTAPAAKPKVDPYREAPI